MEVPEAAQLWMDKSWWGARNPGDGLASVVWSPDEPKGVMGDENSQIRKRVSRRKVIDPSTSINHCPL